MNQKKRRNEIMDDTEVIVIAFSDEDFEDDD
jgi:hypothetical protein